MKLRRTKEPMGETNFRASEIPASTNGGPAVDDDATPLPELGDVGPLLTRHQVAELLNVESDHCLAARPLRRATRLQGRRPDQGRHRRRRALPQTHGPGLRRPRPRELMKMTPRYIPPNLRLEPGEAEPRKQLDVERRGGTAALAAAHDRYGELPREPRENRRQSSLTEFRSHEGLGYSTLPPHEDEAWWRY